MRSIQAAALVLAVSASPALAQRVPSIVIPGRLDVPVIMNGLDISWSVVEGDFGLDRPRGVTPTVIYGPLAVVAPYYGAVWTRPGTGYFPSTGERPGYGRLEVVPPPDRPLPPPAQSFRQGWSAQSAPGPSTTYAPFAPPTVVWGAGPYWRGRPHGPPRPPGGAGPPRPGPAMPPL